VKKSIHGFEAYLKEFRSTVNALPLLQTLQQFYAQDGDAKPVARCEQLMQACRLPRDSRRAFYAQVAPCWAEWHVIVPFIATGERRGMDINLEPGRNVDLTWKTKGPGEVDLTWTKLSYLKDKNGRLPTAFAVFTKIWPKSFPRNSARNSSTRPTLPTRMPSSIRFPSATCCC